MLTSWEYFKLFVVSLSAISLWWYADKKVGELVEQKRRYRKRWGDGCSGNSSGEDLGGEREL